MSKKRNNHRARQETPKPPAENGHGVRVEPCYPCPLCYRGDGGVGVTTHTLPAIVYLRCPKCDHTWSTTRKDGKLYYGMEVSDGR